MSSDSPSESRPSLHLPSSSDETETAASDRWATNGQGSITVEETPCLLGRERLVAGTRVRHTASRYPCGMPDGELVEDEELEPTPGLYILFIDGGKRANALGEKTAVGAIGVALKDPKGKLVPNGEFQEQSSRSRIHQRQSTRPFSPVSSLLAKTASMPSRCSATQESWSIKSTNFGSAVAISRSCAWRLKKR